MLPDGCRRGFSHVLMRNVSFLYVPWWLRVSGVTCDSPSSNPRERVGGGGSVNRVFKSTNSFNDNIDKYYAQYVYE